MPGMCAKRLLLPVLLLCLATSPAAPAADEWGEESAAMELPRMSAEDFLMRAVDRGVPLFNEGQPAACAAVYATALEALVHSDGFGLPGRERLALGYQLAVASGIDDASDRAWAHRRLIDSLLAGEPLSLSADAEARTLFDFSDLLDAPRWRVVVDGVMGGLSTGQLAQEGDTMVFTGRTSLRNNGGFSSIRVPIREGSVAGYDALRIRVKGDGRTWILGARGASMRGDSHWTRFETKADEWQTVTVPIRSMVRQYFGTPIQGRLEPEEVRGLEFYIYDKQAGPFRLQVERIEAVRTGG